jgi:hypothetical protein
MGALRWLSVIGLLLTVPSRASVAVADEPKDDVTHPPPSPSPPPAPMLVMVSFEGKKAEVTLGSTPSRSCTVPCEMAVAPGVYELAIDGRPSEPVVVGEDLMTVVRLKDGSPAMIYGGAILIAAGLALAAGGIVEASTPSTCSGGEFALCFNLNPLVGGFLAVVGAAWGVAGIGFTVGGAVHTTRAVRDLRPPTPSSSWAPRVLPWATAESGLRGGAGGLTIVF